MKLIKGDVFDGLKQVDNESVDCCITSPPYWGLRQYSNDPREIGQEEFYTEYLAKMQHFCVEIYRVLKPNGNFWLNLGDTYMKADQGIMKKGSLAGIPWQVALKALLIGWILREDIIWEKSKAMPESIDSRCTRSHEMIFHFVKSLTYQRNYARLLEPCPITGKATSFAGGTKYKGKGLRTYSGKEYVSDGLRNKRSVWKMTPGQSKSSHVAPFPDELVMNCLKASFEKQFEGVVLDPFVGSGTTGKCAQMLGLDFIGIDLTIGPDLTIKGT